MTRINEIQFNTTNNSVPSARLENSEPNSIWSETSSSPQVKIQKPVNEMSEREIANELHGELNKKNKERITELLDGLNSKNVYNTYAYYQSISRSNGEIAATKEEQEELNSWFPNYRSIKFHAKRPETLFQGILNNEALNIEEKREYLHKLCDSLVEYAKGRKDVPGYRVSKFQERQDFLISECTPREKSAANNSYELEEALAVMLGYAGKK